MSFRDWITGLRIEYAKRLLTQYPKLTVADISERSGFISPSHFTRLFKKKCRVYSCQMEKERNRIARPVANEGNSLCNKKSLNDNSKIS